MDSKTTNGVIRDAVPILIAGSLCYGIGSYNFSILWIFGLSVAAIVYYWGVHNEKHEVALRKVEGKMLSDVETEEGLREELRARGSGLPAWVVFSDSEKVTWLNTLVKLMWPNIAKATEDSIRYSVQPLLDYYRPTFLSDLSFAKLKLGNSPLTITGVKTMSASKDEVIVDMDVVWAADPDLVVKAVATGLTIEAALKDVHFASTLRLSLSPLVDAWPCFSALSLSFTSKPTLEYSLSTAKLPLSAIPGLAGWLNNFLKEVSFSWMIWPKKLPIPILDMDAVALAQLSQEYPKGVLRVKVIEARDLKNSSMLGKADPYVEVAVGKNVKRTKTVKKTLNPKFLEEFEFEITHPWTQYYFIRVKDDDPLTDDFMGSVELSVAKLLPTAKKPITAWHDILKKGKTVSKSGKSYGQLRITTTWEPYSEEKLESFVKEGLEQMKKDRERQARIARGELSSESTTSILAGGTIEITVLEAKNLSEKKTVDPLILLNLNGKKFKSEKIKNDPNPSWRHLKKEQYWKVEAGDLDQDILKVKAYDWEMVGSNELIGVGELPLRNLTANSLEEVWVPLENHQGRVCLAIKVSPYVADADGGGISAAPIDVEDSKSQSQSRHGSRPGSRGSSRHGSRGAGSELVDDAAPDREATISVKVLSGANLNKDNSVDPYVKVKLLSTGEEGTIPKILRTANPVWKDAPDLHFVTSAVDKEELHFMVMDWESMRSDLLLGAGVLRLSNVPLDESDPIVVDLSIPGAQLTVAVRVSLLETEEEPNEEADESLVAVATAAGVVVGPTGIIVEEAEEKSSHSKDADSKVVEDQSRSRDKKDELPVTPRDSRTPAQKGNSQEGYPITPASASQSQSVLMMSRETSFGSLIEDDDSLEAASIDGLDELASQRGRLVVRVEKGYELMGKQPYVKLKLGAAENKTKVYKSSKGKDPVWGAEFQFTVQDSLTDKLLVKVRDDRMFRDGNLGSLNIHVREIQASPNMEIRKNFSLQGIESGKLGMSIRFIPLGSESR